MKNYKSLKGIIICKESGEYFLDLILDTNINPVLLSSFVGALCLFGKDNLGKIEEINIKGLDIDMIIVYKYNLILIAIMEKNVARHDIRNEAIKALDMFYALYKNEINKCVDVGIFESFKNILLSQIKEYFEKLKDLEKRKDIGDFGFFTEAIKKSRSEFK